MPELDWLGKEKALKAAGQIPYRILKHNPDLSYGDENNNNMLIQGDNLDALKALLPYYAGQVKCIYIDPPYNTKNAFEHYDDNLEHSAWLSLMYPRLELLREFLSQDGTIWISIDDDEGHYLKVICDDVFGRKNSIETIVWQRAFSPVNLKKTLSRSHDYVLVYAKQIDYVTIYNIPRSESQLKNYKNPDNDARGLWTSSDFSVGPAIQSKLYPIKLPSGRLVIPPKGRCWVMDENRFYEMVSDNRIWFGENGNNAPRVKKFLSEVKDGVTPMTLWLRDEVGDNQEAKREIKVLFDDDVFTTPKPERLIQRIIQLATQEDDIVMDSFLGSGTTTAVALKMNRRWIGIEMGNQAVTHCAPRMQKVVDGEQGGISKAENWEGGGGFRFYTLGSPIFDADGKIHPEVKFETLANHIWFVETGCPLTLKEKSPLLGVYNNIAYYLLFNGILGDKSLSGGNVLTTRILTKLPKYDGPKVIYGELTKLSSNQLKEMQISFKQIPYDIKAR